MTAPPTHGVPPPRTRCTKRTHRRTYRRNVREDCRERQDRHEDRKLRAPARGKGYEVHGGDVATAGGNIRV
eukprot:7788194-Pyramimonas_sp.AAC.1